MKRLMKLSLLLIEILCVFGITTAAAGCFLLPDSFEITQGDTIQVGNLYSISGKTKAVFSNGNQTNSKSEYEAEITVLGVIPVKSVTVAETPRRQVIVSGALCGLRIYSEGVTVVDTDTLLTNDGLKQPASDAGFLKGDIIVKVNEKTVNTADEISGEIDRAQNTPLTFTIKRNQETMELSLSPMFDKNTGTYRTGLWLRDSAAGIGTMTFYDPETMAFGCLGHSVCDVDTGLAVTVRSGEATTAILQSVQKGGNGKAGELSGALGQQVLGNILENGENGVYGVLQNKPAAYGIYPVANADEIQVGPAQVITTVDNSGPKAYSVEIEKVNTSGSNKDLMIHVVDTALLAQTGGIVQGMSGSPLIQDGKFIGAVTHVFLDDSSRGYGISAPHMIARADDICQQQDAA